MKYLFLALLAGCCSEPKPRITWNIGHPDEQNAFVPIQSIVIVPSTRGSCSTDQSCSQDALP